MKSLLAGLTLACLLLPAAGGANPYPAVRAYSLDAAFDLRNSSMVGKAEITFETPQSVADSAVFLLHGELSVDSVLCGGRLVKNAQSRIDYSRDYSLQATRTVVEIPEGGLSGPLVVYYRGFFKPSQARSESDYMRIDTSGVYLRSYYYSLWFPVFLPDGADDYAVDFKDVRLSVPEEFRAVFIGNLASDSVDQGNRISHWRAADAYLFQAQCTARRYRVRSEGGVQIYYLDDQQSESGASQIASFVNDLLKRYAERYASGVEAGEFHIMEMPEYGDIGSGRTIGFSEELWRTFESEDFPKQTLAHELVHAYVQPPISQGEPLAALMVEGFPSYFHLPILGEIFGRGWYEDYMRNVEKQYITRRETGEDRRGRPLPEEKPIDQISFDQIRHYKDRFVLNDRVRLFLDYLRRRMGAPTFHEYCKSLFEVKSLDSKRFLRISREYYPGDDDDIRVWLSTTDYPDRFRMP